MDTVIREALASDSVALAELVRQEAEFAQALAQYYQLDPDFDWVRSLHRKLTRDDKAIFVAEKSGEVVGFIEVRIVHYPATQRRRFLPGRSWRRRQSDRSVPLKPISWGVIEGCFVVQSLRRSGTGTALVDKAMQWFARSSIARVELGVLANNDEAQTFWQRLGFGTFRVVMQRRVSTAPTPASTTRT